MAHLWIPIDAGGHAVLRLENTEHDLPLNPHHSAEHDSSPASLVRLDATDSWALVVAPSLRARVNGVPVWAGLAVLADRDEIRLSGTAPLWFSTETIARVEDAPVRDGHALTCPRCREPIEAGSPAVACPGCRVWHHQKSDRPCFTYKDAPCGACGERFELDGTFRFTPEEL